MRRALNTARWSAVKRNAAKGSIVRTLAAAVPTMAIGIVALGILAGALPAGAQDWSQPWARARIDQSPRHSEWVTVKHGERSVETLVVYPESKEKRPVVLVIHEIFGLSGLGAGACRRGCRGRIHRRGAGPAERHGAEWRPHQDFPGGGSTEAVSNLDPDQVTADLNAAADYGRSCRPRLANFSWRDSAGAARKVSALPRVAAILRRHSFFTARRPSNEAMAHITAPVYGFYAGNDARVDATIPDTVAAMKAAGKTYQPVTYDGAGHGFMRAGEAPDANAPTRKLARIPGCAGRACSRSDLRARRSAGALIRGRRSAGALNRARRRPAGARQFR